MYALTRTTPQDLSCMFKGLNRKTIIKQYDEKGSVLALRQMPENHCLCVRRHTEWVISQDPAADRNIMYVIFELLFYHELKWDTTGHKLYDAIIEIMHHGRAAMREGAFDPPRQGITNEQIKAYNDANTELVDWTDHQLAAYLREQSGDNNWYWKALSNANNFYTSKGRWIATVFYDNATSTKTKIYIPKRVRNANN
jgi:hypothetical protein